MNLITGASGHFGKIAAEKYLTQNPNVKLAILSRSEGKVNDLVEKGAELRMGDYADYDALVKAFSGIEKVLLVSSNDLQNREIHHKNAIDAAKEAGVKKIIFTSFQFNSVEENSPNGLMPVYVATENYLKESGLDYTILRNGIYTDFLPDIIGPAITENKTLYAPAGDTEVVFTSRTDLAEAASNVLAGDNFTNTTLDLTNSEGVNFAEITLVLSQILKTEIQYINPSQEDYQIALTNGGLPADVVGLFSGIIESMQSGEFSKTTATLTDILGRKPESVRDFLSSFYA